jgi:hypothetical protein
MAFLLNFIAVMLMSSVVFVTTLDLRPRPDSPFRLRTRGVAGWLIMGDIIAISAGIMTEHWYLMIAAAGTGFGLGPLLRMIACIPGRYLQVIFIPYLTGIVCLMFSVFM